MTFNLPISDTIFIALIGLIGILIQARAQITIARLNTRLDTAESAHETLKVKVQSDAQNFADLRKQDLEATEIYRKQSIESGNLVASLNTNLGLLRTEYGDTKSKLDDVTSLSERQKVEIQTLSKQQDKNVANLQEARETIATLTSARDTDHRTFENTISEANDLHDRKQRELQSKIEKLTTDLEAANKRIDELTDKMIAQSRQMADLDSSNLNLGIQISKLRTDLDTVTAERDQAISERDQALQERDAARRELDALLSNKDSVQAMMQQIQQPPAQ